MVNYGPLLQIYIRLISQMSTFRFQYQPKALYKCLEIVRPKFLTGLLLFSAHTSYIDWKVKSRNTALKELARTIPFLCNPGLDHVSE